MIAVPDTTSDLERFLALVWRPGDVREVRVIHAPGKTDSGYFDDPAIMAAAVGRYDGRTNVYVTINPVTPALLARAANRIKANTRTATSDADIVERRWLPIDIDPTRPTGISATEAEREAALAVSRDVYAYLRDRGWPNPVTAMSGNGYWLLYPIDLPNDPDAEALVKGALRHLSERFGTKQVAIDQTVSNASRIVALIGTVKLKGDPTTDRPHRRSALTYRPPELVPVTREQLAELAPPPEPKAVAPDTIRVGGDRMPAGWVKALLDGASVRYREGTRRGQTWYRLDQCPFHPDDDQGGDCGVGEDADGKGLGHCFHNRGAGKGWREFRDALGLPPPVGASMAPTSSVAAPRRPPVGMDAADLLAKDIPPLRWIVPDLIPEGTTIIAAPPKIGKSCLIYQIAVEASVGGDLFGRRVTAGSVLYYALEDGQRRGQDRLRAALTGRTMPHGRLEVRWSAPAIGQGLEEEISAWLDEHQDAVLVAVDTLGKARPPTDGRRNAYEVDVALLSKLQDLFRDRPVALLIVHHARKDAGDDFLASVSGTYGITGSVDTIVALKRLRHEEYGQIVATGRDIPEAEISVRFVDQLWIQADAALTVARWERQQVYAAIEQSPEPIHAQAISKAIGISRTSVQNMMSKMAADGVIVRQPSGYVVARVRLFDDSDDSSQSSESSTPSRVHGPVRTGAHAGAGVPDDSDDSSQSSESSGGSPLRAGARTREGAPHLTVIATEGVSTQGWCHFPADHQTRHRDALSPDPWCEICTPRQPEEDHPA